MYDVSDRSWTIAPTLLWFGAVLVGGLLVLDGGPQALANRLTQKREAKPTTPIAPAPTEVAEADSDDTVVTAPPPPAPAGSHDIGVLEDTCIDSASDGCKHWAMDGFYKSIANAKAGKLGRAVRVSWYGDSVVATDAIPGRLRTRMQTELGDGGPGYVFVIAPHKFMGHEAITRGFTGAWNVHAISMKQVPDGMYGVGGSSADTEDGRANVKLVAGRVTTAELYYLAQPGGGTVLITADKTEIVNASTRGETKQAAWVTGTIEGGATQFKLATEGRVRVFGLSLENSTGAVVDNLGVISVNVKSFAANDTAHWSAELGHRSADLVMIMIGANEAEWLGPKDQDTKDYQGRYEKVLEPIRKARPDAACLVVSPTDQAEAKDDGYVSRPVMPVLVNAQRKAAHAAGCAFYSTYDWMGGRGSAAKWFKKGLVSSDFQHLSKKGANKMADAVFDALMTGYQRYAPK